MDLFSKYISTQLVNDYLNYLKVWYGLTNFVFIFGRYTMVLTLYSCLLSHWCWYLHFSCFLLLLWHIFTLIFPYASEEHLTSFLKGNKSLFQLFLWLKHSLWPCPLLKYCAFLNRQWLSRSKVSLVLEFPIAFLEILCGVKRTDCNYRVYLLVQFSNGNLILGT